MKTLITILAMLALTGCAGTKVHTDMLIRDQVISLHQSDSAEYDYKIMIRNAYDFGMDLEKEEDRKKQVEIYFQDQCKKIVFLNESVINNGIYGLTKNPRKTYVMKIKCEV